MALPSRREVLIRPFGGSQVVTALKSSAATPRGAAASRYRPSSCSGDPHDVVRWYVVVRRWTAPRDRAGQWNVVRRRPCWAVGLAPTLKKRYEQRVLSVQVIDSVSGKTDRGSGRASEALNGSTVFRVYSSAGRGSRSTRRAPAILRTTWRGSESTPAGRSFWPLRSARPRWLRRCAETPPSGFALVFAWWPPRSSSITPR